MEIGYQNNPRKDVLKEVEWIGKNGFDFVDLFLEEDRAVPGKVDVPELKALLGTHGLGVVGHTAWYLPIGSPFKRIREACISLAEGYFDIFRRLDVSHVTIHANWPGSLFSDKEGVGFQADTLNGLAEKAGECGIGLMYEHLNTQRDSRMNISSVLKKVKGLGFHLDTGHAHMHGREPADMVKRFHKRLMHVHMNDNDGTEDQHLPIGYGTIDWEGLVKELKKRYDRTITLEIFSSRRHVLESRQALRGLWDAL